MQAATLIREIEKRGGTAAAVVAQTSECSTISDVIGVLNGYDVHMIGLSQSFFTARPIAKRGYDDQGSDYNSGGYTFYSRIKDLDRLV